MSRTAALLPAAVTVALALPAPRPALAEGPTSLFFADAWQPTLPEGTLRGFGYSRVEFHDDGDELTRWGIGAALQTGPYVLEAEYAEAGMPGGGHSQSTDLRAGLAPPLGDWRDADGAGAELEIGLLLGYRYYDLQRAYFGEDDWVSNEYHMLTITVGLELLYWFWRYTAIGVRLGTSTSIPLADGQLRSSDPSRRFEIGTLQRLGLSLGLRF